MDVSRIVGMEGSQSVNAHTKRNNSRGSEQLLYRILFDKQCNNVYLYQKFDMTSVVLIENCGQSIKEINCCG